MDLTRFNSRTSVHGAGGRECEGAVNLRIMAIMTTQAKTPMRLDDRMGYFCHNSYHIMRRLTNEILRCNVIDPQVNNITVALCYQGSILNDKAV